MTSLRLRLLKWLIGPILLLNLAGGALMYLLAWLPAQQALDRGLADSAGALAARVTRGPAGLAIDLPRQAEQILRADDADDIYFVVRSAGRTLAGDADFPALPPAPQGRAGAFDSTMRGAPVRIAVVDVNGGGQGAEVAVGTTLRKREETRSAILRALVPLQALLTLAVIGLIWFSVSTGLLPLARLRSSLKARDGEDLSHLDPDAVPGELAPVVGAFNELLDKVAAGAQARHEFLANVAHQLRTPLAGLTLQLEWLAARHASDSASAHSIGLMQSLAERMTRQTNQLLALARAEPGQAERPALVPLDLAALVAEPVQYFVERAAHKRIDLGFELEPAQVAGDRFLLRDLADNLIDNALRYTPEGGTVTVRVAPLPDGCALLSVEDSGPGIAPAARALVFARGVRLSDQVQGSGLGLSIVREIARVHRAGIEVGAPASGTGAVFTVRFPAP
ncbi:sensor histidine kinase [Pseudoduganella sp. GCM10020061]|uniref:sensor histidine kinase n=1 Tax=Pseudoduganella sp. GCM10020061 TaxID=3317345 RepID=UPI003629A51C